MSNAQESNSLPTDFENDRSVDGTGEENSDQPQAPARDESGIPYCPLHHVRMKQVSGGKKGSPVAYHSCPVKDCKETGKRLKAKEPSVPKKPHPCPKCSNGKREVIMERSAQHSRGYYSIMQCPDCGYKSAPMPRPEFVTAQDRSRRQTVANLGDR